jgi:hypothetical protein
MNRFAKFMGTANSDLVNRVLLDRFLTYIRFSAIGLFLANIFFFGLLYLAGVKHNLVLYTVAVQLTVIVLTVYFFALKPTTPRFTFHYYFLLSSVFLVFLGSGFILLDYYVRTDEQLQKIIVILAIGVTGAAAFTFSANKMCFLLAGIALMGPLFVYFLISPNMLHDKVIAIFVVIYLTVLNFLSRQDYNRRVLLVETEHSLRDERDLVTTQSKKLQVTLEEVHNLKKQQDGDYFLTSLLLKPLGLNTVETNAVKVEFSIKQKKQFYFKNWLTEIGGDICIAHEIKLNGKNYVIFINADAMGKSMQGAGGAIVLGAVFQSYIERTRTMPAYRDNYPERWLKNAFLELQSVFESFDGSMLISMVLGLVDEITGMLYYINAEHPAPILLRDGKAEFLPEDAYYRKLGTPGVAGRVNVSTFPLKSNDIIFVGSDGKDDLLIGRDSFGQRIINEDEKLFLSIIERHPDSLEQIFAALPPLGEITDDLSLMKVQYFAVPAESPAELMVEWTDVVTKARELLQQKKGSQAHALLLSLNITPINDVRTLKAIAKMLFQLRDWENAALYSEKLAETSSNQNRYLFVAAHCHKKLRNLQKSIALSDRIRLREPGNIQNLLNLVECHLALRDRPRAHELLEEIFFIDANNERAQKLSKLAAA